MKKLLLFILCLSLACGMMVSCSEDEIGSYLPNYDYKPEVKEELTLNLYLITNPETDKNAMDTVSQMISQYTEREFKAKLNVTYLTADEYYEKVSAAVDADGNTGANIVLITSPAMMNDFISRGKIAILNKYFESDEFGSLNVSIPEALLEEATLEGNIVAVPNNRIIGEYEYLVINKDVAIIKNYGVPSEVASYTSLEDASELIDTLTKNGYNASDYIYTCRGGYALKAELEAQGNYCNVVTYPTADNVTAFGSAFAVINRGENYNERAMQIIYAINTDTYLRNLLQYGVFGTNYTLDDDGNVISVKSGVNVYSMNPEYTGNVFKLYYSPEIGWTKTVADNGMLQNDQSVSSKNNK